LQESLPNQPVDVVDLIQAAVLLVSPLAESNQVHLVIDARKDLPLAIGQTTTFRQVLVTVLSTAVRSAIGGRVIISAEVKGRSVDCRIRPVSRSFQPTSLPYEENDNLEIARRLIEILGGTCQVQIPGEDHNSFDVHLALPIIEGAAILVVDDNIDTLQLLQRYTVGSRYRFIGLRDPQEVMRVAQELLPQIIVLDVMLPHIDGWELMGRLLEHPVTRHIPVLICSILPHEHLAATMGAAGFIRKPVTRRAFLKALDDHLVN
jgi:CheY-like chemotaxis protein